MSSEELQTAIRSNCISVVYPSSVQISGIQEDQLPGFVSGMVNVNEFIHKATLANGIRVVTKQIPHARSIAIGIMFDASPHTEPIHQNGIAHLSEHAMFQGTSSRDATEIARQMDVGGGSIGAFTARDYTCYYAIVLDDYRTYAMDLLGDILLNSVAPYQRIESEKRAILGEIESVSDSPLERAQANLKTFAWRDHPLGRPILGRKETVREFTREDVIYFVHGNYLPDRMIVAAAGNVDHRDFLAQVRDAFWRMTGQGESLPQVAPRFNSGATIESMPVSQAYFCLGIRAFRYSHPDRYAVHVLNNVLGSGTSSRLYRRLRDEHGLVYHIGSEYHAYRQGGMLVIEGSTAPEYLHQVLSLTVTELRNLLASEEAVDDEELWRAKMHIHGQHILAGENSHTCMSRLATQEFYFERPITSEEILAQINAVDIDCLQRLSGDLMADSDSRIAISVVCPDSVQGSTAATVAELANQVL